jgi:aspartate/methionine/tyrosine aminotransferase
VTHSFAKTMTFKNLTGYEIDTLAQSFNLTDGHAFRSWSPEEEAIIDRAAELFKSSNRQAQAAIEREYIGDFLHLAKQTHDESRVGYLMCFSASTAFEVIANYLRLKRSSMALIEPAFDNLADIFRRHEILLRPFPDTWMEEPAESFAERLRGIEDDSICLVTPNNPTGSSLPEQNLRLLAAFCAEQGKLLILDNCFRAYLPRDLVYDQYHILLESGADFVMVEDTGKTWPTSEIKAPFFAVSRARGLFQKIYDICTDFLLHISPVGIRLVHEFIRLSRKDDLAQIRSVVRANREALYSSLAGTFLTPCEKPYASVAWLRIDAPMSGSALKQVLDRHGVYVLPGNLFYWSDHERGDRYIRVALTRDAGIFAQAAAVIGHVCRKLTIKKDARREIIEQGFTKIARSDWCVSPSFEWHWERMREDWERLEVDHHLKDGAAFRRRRYGRYYWSPVEDTLLPLPNEPYFQPEGQNAYAGGVSRSFAPLLPDSVENPFLMALVRCAFDQLPIGDEKRQQVWEVRVHQIRILAAPGAPGEPAPEGIHQDGTDFLTLHLVRRENVAGAESTIYDLERRPLFRYTMSEAMDSFILEDPRIMHGVTAVHPSDGRSPAIRDLLGLDFIFNPDLRPIAP